MKSKERLQQTGEIFTPPELVELLTSRVPKSYFISPDKSFLDHACGSGNLLICIYEEKIEHGHEPHHALSTIYGVDIMDDNIAICKERLKEVAIYYGACEKRVDSILINNIVWANSLEYDFKFRRKDNRADTSRLKADNL